MPPELVPLAIDEFPILFIAAAAAEGETIVSGAEELRKKETDRIAVMARALEAVGIEVEERPDGARIVGGRMRGGTVDSRGDHRIAMSFAVASVRAASADRDSEHGRGRDVVPEFPRRRASRRPDGHSARTAA